MVLRIIGTGKELLVMESITHALQGPSATTGIWHPSFRRITLGLVLTVAAAAFESLSVATTMPAVLADVGGLPLYGWAFSAFMLTTLVGLAAGGSEADRLGPRRPFLAGVVLFSVGLVLAGFAPSMEVLILARAIQGLGAGLVSTIAYVIIGRSYPEANRPQMLALISSAYVLPSLIGPALAGLIADQLGWRWTFLGLAPLLPLAAGLAAPAMASTAQPDSTPRDWSRLVASVALATGMTLLVAGLGSAQNPLLALLLIGGGGLLAIPALRRLLPAGAFGHNRVRAVLLSSLLVNMAFFGIDAFVPLALTSIRGQTATAAGFVLTAATIAWTASVWLQARLVTRGSRRRLVLVGLVLMSLGVGGAIAVLQPQIPVAVAPLAWAVAGLGMGLASPTLTLLALELAERGQEGRYTSVMQLAGVLGIAIGTGIGGVLVGAAEGGSYTAPDGLRNQYLLMAGVLGLALLTVRWLPHHPQGEREMDRAQST
jgi:MFS family permease